MIRVKIEELERVPKIDLIEMINREIKNRLNPDPFQWTELGANLEILLPPIDHREHLTMVLGLTKEEIDEFNEKKKS